MDGYMRRAGVSLVELLAVIVMLGVLAGIAVFAVRGPRSRAEVARLAAEAHNFRLAQETYRADVGRPYNGPFTPGAARAAGFGYILPSDVTITIDSSDEDTWGATMVAAPSSPHERQPTCRLSLSGAPIACTLGSPRREELSPGAPSSVPIPEITPAR